MELHGHFFIFFQKYPSGPKGVEEHQGDGQKAGYAVEVKGEASGGDFAHDGSTQGIENEADPKGYEMPWLQATLELFTPDTDGVKRECQNHGNDRVN